MGGGTDCGDGGGSEGGMGGGHRGRDRIMGGGGRVGAIGSDDRGGEGWNGSGVVPVGVSTPFSRVVVASTLWIWSSV